jgi:hypothetical protein
MDPLVDFQCPGCETKISVKLSSLRPGGTCECPQCGTITFQGDDVGGKVQKELDGLKRSIDNLSKSLKIRL